MHTEFHAIHAALLEMSSKLLNTIVCDDLYHTFTWVIFRVLFTPHWKIYNAETRAILHV